MGTDGSPRYFLRSDTGQWGEIIHSFDLATEEIDADTASVIDGNVWITYELENNYEEPAPEEILVVPPQLVMGPMPEDTAPYENLDRTAPGVYSDNTSPDGPVEP